MSEFLVCYEVFDEDKFLYCICRKDQSKSEHAVFEGTQKECHIYIAKHQKHHSTPSLKKIPWIEQS